MNHSITPSEHQSSDTSNTSEQHQIDSTTRCLEFEDKSALKDGTSEPSCLHPNESSSPNPSTSQSHKDSVISLLSSNVPEDRECRHTHVEPTLPASQCETEDNRKGTRTEDNDSDSSSEESPVSRPMQIQPPDPPRPTLPDIVGQPDPNGVLQRRVLAYDSFVAPDSFMRQIPEVDETLFSNERQPHLTYQIKTIATVKCDECRYKCRRQSEVYKCCQCTAQICRECVEHRLMKERPGYGRVPWEWLNQSHEPFKRAYLRRKEVSSGSYPTGDWVGDVQITSLQSPVRVTIYAAPASRVDRGSNKRKASSDREVDIETSTSNESSNSRRQSCQQKKSEEVNAADDSRRKYLQDSSMKPDTRSKLQRIEHNAETDTAHAKSKKATTEMLDAARTIVALNKDDESTKPSQAVEKNTAQAEIKDIIVKKSVKPTATAAAKPLSRIFPIPIYNPNQPRPNPQPNRPLRQQIPGPQPQPQPQRPQPNTTAPQPRLRQQIPPAPSPILLQNQFHPQAFQPYPFLPQLHPQPHPLEQFYNPFFQPQFPQQVMYPQMTYPPPAYLPAQVPQGMLQRPPQLRPRRLLGGAGRPAQESKRAPPGTQWEWVNTVQADYPRFVEEDGDGEAEMEDTAE